VKYPDDKSLFDGRNGIPDGKCHSFHHFFFNTQMVNGKSYYMNYPNFIESGWWFGA